MEPWTHLSGLLILLAVALVLGALCERLRQSAILGYLLAGTLLGPNALRVVGNDETVKVLAELGVALLLFSIGLEFSWRRLKRMGPAALGGGTVQITATMAAAGLIALMIGRPVAAAIAIGAIVALSSTALVLRSLSARAELESMQGRNALGILLTQDIAVVPLVLLIGVLGNEGGAGQVTIDLLKTLGIGAVLVLAFVGLFNYIVPLILSTRTMEKNRELPILLAVVVGLGSTWAAHEAGLSPALGAFVAGVLLAESPYAMQVRADVGSLRTLLMTLFFASVGMVGDPGWIISNAGIVTLVTVAIVVGKAMIIWGVLWMFGLRSIYALATGICLGQVGEFSFVLAEIARGTVISETTYSLMISATIGTLFVTPYLVRGSVPVAAWLLSRSKHPSQLVRDDEGADAKALHDHIVLIGFGPAGQAVGDVLYRSGETVLVVDLSRRSLDAASRLGFRTMLADATHPEVLEHAHVERARAVVSTIPHPESARRVVLAMRSAAPGVPILARARYHVYQLELSFAGAEVVVDEEREVGVRLGMHLRRLLRKRKAGEGEAKRE